MISNKLLGIVFLVVLVAVAGGAYSMRTPPAPAAPPAPPPVKPTGIVRDFNVTISNKGFWDKGVPATPPKFEANLGDTFRILIKAVDMDHAFVIDDYNIKKFIRKGEAVVIEFVATKPGIFTVYDDIPGHQYQEQTQLFVYSPPKMK